MLNSRFSNPIVMDELAMLQTQHDSVWMLWWKWNWVICRCRKGWCTKPLLQLITPFLSSRFKLTYFLLLAKSWHSWGKDCICIVLVHSLSAIMIDISSVYSPFFAYVSSCFQQFLEFQYKGLPDALISEWMIIGKFLIRFSLAPSLHN